MPRNKVKLSIQPGVDAIVGIDADGRITFLNKRTEELFQYSKAELLGRPAEVLIPVRLRRSYSERSRRNAADPWYSFREAGIQFAGRRRDGTEFRAEILPDLLETESGVVTFLGIRDLINQENLGAQLSQAKKMEALGQFAGGIAHDLNNLLNVILGYAETALQDFQRKPSVLRSLEEIQRATATAASLSCELLFFSRKTSSDFQIINLNEIVREMKSLLQRLVGEHITITLAEGPDLGSVKADESQMKQVIMNLVANARDAMPNGGRLEIETANVEIRDDAGASSQQLSAGLYVVLKITDTGCGMDAETRSHLFNPFFTTKDKGTGFGLANVYEIIKQSGGEVSVTSAPLRGTTFTIHMPRVTKAEKEVRDKKPAPIPLSTGEIILVVEDTMALRKLICQFLKRRGYRVLEARDGPSAFLKIKRYPGPIDLLLTDVMIPTISGFELAMHLRERRPHARALFITGHTEDAIRRLPHWQEGAKVLKKPFSLNALAQTIYRILNSSTA